MNSAGLGDSPNRLQLSEFNGGDEKDGVVASYVLEVNQM